jgi:aryl-alcohol dehydrogenase-like predicted oxidoreductase
VASLGSIHDKNRFPSLDQFFRASMGETPVARHAGMKQAARATLSLQTAVTVSVDHSFLTQRRTHMAQVNRREALIGLAALAASSQAATGSVPRRTLGHTGESVSCIGLGGYHIGKPKLSDDEATHLIRRAVDSGINFLDNSWDYNDGKSEIRMGNALRDGYRQKVFLMTKFDGRTKESAAKQIDESLKRLQTDHVDLIQFHENIRFDDPDRFFSPGGAVEAVMDAKKAGKTRFIGFTGHKDPHIHLYMLELAQKNNFQFDTVQMPLNVMDAHFRSFAKLVVPQAQKMGLGILGMKSMGDSVILKSKTATPVECLQYALSLPTSVVITGIDGQPILDQALQVATNFKQLTSQQVVAILNKTAAAASKGEYELFKTSAHFDSTAKHPEWLGGEAPNVHKLGSDT